MAMSTAAEMRMPWLIQRVTKRLSYRSSSVGVDRYFSFDYMGSAEFEFGALPKTLEVMRKNHDSSVKPWTPTKIEVGKLYAWYVGESGTLPLAKELFEQELLGWDSKLRFQERTEIARAYGRNNGRNNVKIDFPCDIIGWWAIGVPHPFILFKVKEDAENWLKGLQEKKGENCEKETTLKKESPPQIPNGEISGASGEGSI